MTTVKVYDELYESEGGANGSYIVHPKVGDVGFDLRSAIDIDISPRTYAAVKTSVKLGMDENSEFFFWVTMKSGLSLKNGVMIMGGIIDPGYRGEVVVLLYNTSDKPFQITRGMKIAQGIFLRYEVPTLNFVQTSQDLDLTERGDMGFGQRSVL